MPDSPLLFRWRRALLSESGPTANRRYVLLVLSTYGDEKGADIYPSTRELARATGMSRRRVEGHLRGAESEGWIRRRNVGEGQGWRRTRYTLLVPSERGDDASPPTSENVETERPQLDPERGDAVARRGDVASADVGTERPTTSPKTSPKTSPSPPEGAPDAAEPESEPSERGGEPLEDEGTPTTEGDTTDSDPERMAVADLVGAWIARQPQRPPEAVIRRQGAAAQRLARDADRPTLESALEGIGRLYPHSEGEPWDLFDLEKKLAKALAAPARRNGRQYRDPAEGIDWQAEAARTHGGET